MTPTHRPAFSYDRFLRSFVGLLLAPMAGGAIAMGGYTLAIFTRGLIMGGPPADWPETFLRAVDIGIGSGARIGLGPAFLLGWPLHLLLLRTGFIHLATYITFGAAIAAAAVQIMLMFILSPGPYAAAVPIELALLAASAGGIGAAIFWMIRRPDRDAPFSET